MPRKTETDLPTVIEASDEAAGVRVAEMWRRIDAWFVQHAPPCHDNLVGGRGVRLFQLARIEKLLGVTLPAELRAHLTMYGASRRVNFYEYDGLPVAHMVSRWRGLERLREAGTFKMWKPRELSRAAAQVRWTWWHRGWIPFAQDGGGNLYCVDVDPGPRGRVGQVIGWEIHGGPVGPHARSFVEFLEDYAERLEAGEWEHSDGGCLTRV